MNNKDTQLLLEAYKSINEGKPSLSPEKQIVLNIKPEAHKLIIKHFGSLEKFTSLLDWHVNDLPKSFIKAARDGFPSNGSPSDPTHGW